MGGFGLLHTVVCALPRAGIPFWRNPRTFEDRGLEYLSIISQNLYYEPPTLEEVQLWAETFDMHTPVLADDTDWTGNFVKGASGFPRLVIVGPDMTIVESEVRPNNDAGLRETLEELL